MSTAARSEDKPGHWPPTAVRRLLKNLAVGWIEGDLFYRFDKLTTGWRISSGRGMGFFPETQVLKDLFDDIRLVDEADLSAWTHRQMIRILGRFEAEVDILSGLGY